MWNYIHNLFKTKRWTNKKIAFVAILIATSVSFILLITTILPPLIWPSLKIAIGGLPIKLTGYIFGPVVGGITGVISDLLSFIFKPAYFHWSYTAAFALVGIIPGLVGYFMNRRWRDQNEIKDLRENKIDFINLIFTFFVLIVIAVGMSLFVVFKADNYFEDAKETPIISNKWVFMALTLVGNSSMMVGILIMMFFAKKKTVNNLLPIITFSALLDIVNIPLISYGDVVSLSTRTTSAFINVLTSHILLTPVKIWINMIVIFISYQIISPLIFSKQANGWVR